MTTSSDTRNVRPVTRSGRQSRTPRLPLSMAGPHNPWLVAVIVSIATFMEVLDTSIANVSLHHIAGSLAAGEDESTWVLTSYLVSNAIVLPISGWLATAIGRKRFYMACVALFTVSSLLCGLAPSLGWLIVFRVLQGLGGGGLAPSEQAILADTFAPEQRGMAFALYGIAVVVAPAVGPTLGGWITDNYSWHWVFLINIPVGVFSLLLSSIFLVEPPAETQQRRQRWRRGIRVDSVGFGLVALGLGCLQIVLDKGQREDWFQSAFILWFSAITVISLTTLVVWELSRRDPIVDLPLFRNLNFLSTNVMMFIIGFILFGTTQLLPQFVQSLLGYTATRAGLVITPGGFAVMAMMPVIGFLVRKTQPRYLIATGLMIEALALYHMSTFTLSIAYRDVMWARVFQAVGLAFLFVPISTAAYSGLPPEKTNNASALLNLARNLGGSFGISLAQTWLAQRSQFHQVRLVSHVTPYDPEYQQALQQHIDTLLAVGTARAAAEQQAVGLVHAEVQRQATTLAYLDVFYVMAWGAALAVVFVFLLRKTALGQQAVGH